MPGTVWSVEHEGRRIEVEPDGLWETGDMVRLRVDGELVAEAKADGHQTLVADGVEVEVIQPWWGGDLRFAEIDGRPLEPSPGSRAARREEFAREHPHLYAARHIAAGVAQVLVPLLGLAALLSFLPDVNLPDIPKPNLPDLPFPDLPRISLPQWLRDVLQSLKYVVPILVGIALAVREVRRRRR